MSDTEHDWLTELRHSWPVIGRPAGDELRGVALPLHVSTGNVRVGLDRDGTRGILVPVAPEDEPRPDTEEGPLQLGLVTYRFGPDMQRYAYLTCNRADLFQMFDDVLVDILCSLERDPERPGTTVVDRVSRWRTLFGMRASRLLPLTSQISLVAELYVLALTARDNQFATRAWRGPLREPHDIVLPDRAAEVKAIGATSDTVEIHGLDQLDAPGRPLALVLVTVDEDPDGSTLPETIERASQLADDHTEFVLRLGRAGYATVDADRYPARFNVTRTEFLEVGPETPRIVPSTFDAGVPAGLRAVTYRLDLAALHSATTQSETLLVDWLTGSR